jgi:hypothetical protein
MLSPLYKSIRLYTQVDRSISIHNSEQLQISVPSLSFGVFWWYYKTTTAQRSYFKHKRNASIDVHV